MWGAPLPLCEWKLCRLNDEGVNGGRAAMVASAWGFARGFHMNLCGEARWKEWLGEVEVVGCSPATGLMEAVYDSPTSADE